MPRTLNDAGNYTSSLADEFLINHDLVKCLMLHVKAPLIVVDNKDKTKYAM